MAIIHILVQKQEDAHIYQHRIYIVRGNGRMKHSTVITTLKLPNRNRK